MAADACPTCGVRIDPILGCPRCKTEAQNDRDDLTALVEMLNEAKDRAHWLAVHRRMKLAGHVEELLSVALQVVYDLRGRHARKEPT